MKKRIFISQVMKGRPFDEVENEREIIKSNIIDHYKNTDEEIVFIDTLFDLKTDEISDRIRLYFLAGSIKKLAEADVAYFPNDYEKARGCRIEYLACKEYGIPILMLED